MDYFIPIKNQYFSSIEDWCNRAQKELTKHPNYNNTEHGKSSGWRGHHFRAMCFDQKNRTVRSGGDFKRAEEDGAFPVWWVWPDQISDLIMSAKQQKEGA